MIPTEKLVGDADERAVSPVIGVILMVAITVILAAVIAAFVLDIGPGEQDPSAAIDFEQDGEDLELELQSLDGSADAVVVVDDDDQTILAYGTDSDDSENMALTVSGEERSYDDAEVSGGTIQAISVNDPDNLNSDDGDAITSIDDVENNAILENLD